MLIGATLALLPRLATANWVGSDSRRPGTKALARAVGARDLGLGLGVLKSLSDGSPLRPWLAASALADAADFAATLAHGDRFPASGRAAVLAIAGGSALICAAGAVLADD